MGKGFYLVIEGPDGCGKGTQCNLLADRLSDDFDVFRIREPGGTHLGEQIRSLLLDAKNEEMSALTELFLFSGARRHLIERLVIPALSEGKFVLSDRNFYSTEAYQGAGGKVDISYIRSCNNWATEGVSLDLAIVLDVDAETGLRRARGSSAIEDKIEARSLEYHGRVRDAYREIASREDNCVLVDASKSIDEVHEEVYATVRVSLDA